jgi:signal transduction histidine kinase
MLGRNIALLVPDDDREGASQLLRRAGAGEATSAFESVHLARDGRRVAVSLSVAPVKGPTGIPVGASAIARDITGAKALEDRLRQAQKMEAVGQLAGGVAHDFNNLLTVILGHCAFALADAGDDIRDDIRQAKEAAERAAVLTAQLLAFSRQQELDVRVIDLNAVVRETEGLLGRVLGKGLTLSASPDAESGSVAADFVQLEQILVHLTTNARDAMPDGGLLTIGTANARLEPDEAEVLGVRPGDYVVLRVADTGCGIPEALRERIFDPFFTTKKQGSGTGLGLSTVYGIVKQNRGAVRVDSEVGQGTTFSIYLPCAEATDRSGGADARADRNGVRAPREPLGEELLAVDDREDLGSNGSAIAP